MTDEIKIGDRIKFRAATRWSGREAARVVNGFVRNSPTVRYGGWSDFIVRPDEILEVYPAAQHTQG